MTISFTSNGTTSQILHNGAVVHELDANGLKDLELVNLATEAKPLGAGQTWQDVTASRAVAPSTYTSPNRPIQVNIVATASNGSTALVLTIGGVTLQGAETVAVTNRPASISAVIPANTVYSVAPTSGTATLVSWRELR